jgi:uncharacterized repeat protein (TIGR01451 family)
MLTQETVSPRPRTNLRTLIFKTGVFSAVVLGLLAGPVFATTNLNLKKTDSPDPVAAGNAITYTLELKCNGPDPAADVVVTDTLPAGVTFVSASGTNWSCNHVAGTVICDYTADPFLTTDPNAFITIVVTAPLTAGVLSNSAIATTSTPDNSGGNNQRTITTTVLAPGFTVVPTSGLVTDEDGATDTFTVVLNAPPIDDVVVSAVSDTPLEGVAAPSPLTFTSGNWNIAQTVTVTGQDDILADGDVAYTIVNTFTTTDDSYGTLNSDTAVDDVDATNIATNSNEILDGAFFTVSPCRILDTRVTGGPFVDAETRTYPLVDEIVGCGVSGTASAVSLNITVADTSGSGHFNLYASGVTPLGSIVIPFNAGNNRANNAIVALSVLGQLVAEAELDGGSAELIIDVNGFFE